MIKIKVPATSANIGPGFDSLGLAFKYYSYFSFEEIEEGLVITGCPTEFQNEDNLVYTSFMKAMDVIGYKIKGLRMDITTEVPVSRGLGSSAACIVGGVVGANEVAGRPLSREEIFKICNDIEGHPDNIAPAIFGGLTASLVDEEIPYTVRYDINKELYFYGFVPNFEVSTKEARKALPTELPYKEAIFNVSRVAVLLKGLENGDDTLIKKSLNDKLHEPYRSKLIHEYDKVRKICEDEGCTGFFISGSGPTLMAVSKDASFIEKIENKIKDLEYNWMIKKLEVDVDGAVVEG